MKKQKIMQLILLSCIIITTQISAQPSIEPFLGRWSLYLPGGAGWLDIKQENGYMDADVLWYGGSVYPVDNIYMDNDVLVITRNRDNVLQKDENGKPVRTHKITHWIKLERVGDQLFGKYFEPQKDGLGVSVTKFLGKKIPPLPAQPDLSKVKYGKSISLFNGKNLDGWELTNPDSKNGFKAKDGVLINDPVQIEGQPHIHYGNIKTVQKFEDFNLKLKVNVPKGNNSGIYLRGIYEVQVYDSYGKPLDSHNMGAIYSRITPSVAAEKKPGEWQTFDITLCDRHVTVILNGTTIIDNQPLLGVTGGALTADQFSPGPIYLQGDHGKVMYKDITIRPILK